MTDLLKEADEIRAGAEKSKKRMEDTRDQLKRQAENAWEDTIELVKRHPAKALGVAVGAGFALGAMLIRLSKSREDTAAGRLRGLADTGVDAWERVSGGFNDAISTLKDAVNDAVGKFK